MGRRRARCPQPLAADDPLGTRLPVPVPPAPDGRHLASHFTGADMLVHDLAHLPYLEQLRWRQQHCLMHHGTHAPDVTLAEWEPFDAFAHHQHISLASHLPEGAHGAG